MWGGRIYWEWQTFAAEVVAVGVLVVVVVAVTGLSSRGGVD